MKKFVLIFTTILAVFSLQSQHWNEVFNHIATNGNEGDLNGQSVSISGDYAVVGAVSYNSSSQNDIGAAYVLKKNEEGEWSEIQILHASDSFAIDNFGHSVGISGNYIIVGAKAEDENTSGSETEWDAGSAYIFHKNENDQWQEVQKITASDRAKDANFGWSVAIHEDHAIIGAYRDKLDTSSENSLNNAGSAYIFELKDSIWTEVQKITASQRSENDFFGYSVAIHGDNAIIGAYQEDEDENEENNMNGAGAAYIFSKHQNGSWSQNKKIVASDRTNDSKFGYSVSISDSFAVVGAIEDDSDANSENTYNNDGAAYIFKLANESWNQIQKLTAADRGSYDYFGFSVSISEKSILVSAKGDDDDENGYNNRSDAGSAYLFELNQNSTWEQSQKIVASNRESGDAFGYYVAIDNGNAIIGAQSDDNSNGENSGAAYIFSKCFYATSNEISIMDSTLKTTAKNVNYQWINCATNEAIVDATDSIFKPITTGEYAVIISSGICTDTSECALYTVTTVGLDEHKSLEISFYPNPVQNQLSLNGTSILSEINVFDPTGNRVFNSSLNSNSATLDLKHLAKGLYFIQVTSQQETKTYKFLKE